MRDDEKNMAEQRVALVTGISSGIGQAIAATIAKQGFRTLCHGGHQRFLCRCQNRARRLDLVGVCSRPDQQTTLIYQWGEKTLSGTTFLAKREIGTRESLDVTH